MKAINRRNGSSASIDAQARRLNELLCVQDAVLKCDECGCTLKSPIDVQLHYCDRYETMQNRRGGDPLERHSF